MGRGRGLALLEAVVVTFLWSSSYVLVKFGLRWMTPLTLVALRYIVASLILLAAALVRGETAPLGEPGVLLRLGFLGLSGIAVGQGLQVLGLFHLPAVTVTFIQRNPSLQLLKASGSRAPYPSR